MLLSANLIWSTDSIKKGVTKHACSSVEKKMGRAKNKMWEAAKKKSRIDQNNHSACSALITL